eukprot:Opistho-2@79632
MEAGSVETMREDEEPPQLPNNPSAAMRGKNPLPTHVGAVFKEGWAFLEVYGYAVLIGAVLLCIVYVKISARLAAYNAAREREAREALLQRDRNGPRRAEIEAARQRQQELQEQKAREAIKLREQNEEKKRLEAIEEYDRLKTGRTTATRRPPPSMPPSNDRLRMNT